jgi:hypothetical protein
MNDRMRTCTECGQRFFNPGCMKRCSLECRRVFQKRDSQRREAERTQKRRQSHPESHLTLFERRFIPEPNTGCWLWLCLLDKGGYGSFRLNGKRQRAHRAAYLIYRGPIQDGLVIDHLCRTPYCVNPAHLEPVTHEENTLRGIGTASPSDSRTRCFRGHVFDAIDSLGRKTCSICIEYRASRVEQSRRAASAVSQ